MRCLVRHLTRTRAGGTAHKDTIVDVAGNRLQIGRGTDNEVYLTDLRVAYRHADLVFRDFDVVLEAVEGAPILVDGRPVDRASVTTDSAIEIGPYAVRLLPPGRGVDLGVTVELAAAPQPEDLDRLLVPGGQRLRGGWLGRRPMGWALALVALLLTFGLPLNAYLQSKPRPPGFNEGALPAPPGPADWGAGLDRLWSSGELSASHKYLATRCDGCHEVGFTRVRAEACLTCHDELPHHFPETLQVTGFEPAGCTGCHREHEGPAGSVPVREALCADCHGNLNARLVEAAVSGSQPVKDFVTHPPFRPTVVTDPATGGTSRSREGEPVPGERSGLAFPHDIHVVGGADGVTLERCLAVKRVAPERRTASERREAGRCDVKGAVGAALRLAASCGEPPPAAPAGRPSPPRLSGEACQSLRERTVDWRADTFSCGNCHRPDGGGASFLPVTMAEHCADCHSLRFDRDDPSRLLPHGHPDQVAAAAMDYFMAQELRRPSPGQTVAPDVRRRAGSPSPQEQQVARLNAAASSAGGLVQEVFTKGVTDIFARTTCRECHEITPSASSTAPFAVTPVRVATRWLPRARFDHAAHRQSDCGTCHAAATSATSADVLLPPIATCQSCHGGETSTASIPSTCTMCHDYHRAGLPLFRPAAAPPS